MTLRDNLTPADFTLVQDMLVADASDLGLRATDPTPGNLIVAGQVYRFRAARRDEDGDIVSWIYQAGSPSNQVIMLYND